MRCHAPFKRFLRASVAAVDKNFMVGTARSTATCRARAHRRREKEQVLKIARDIKDAVHELEQLVGRE